ncbi:MAG: response regulator [Chloroflexi bacterium]|nr:response regulator [Chloroflexota bacterium]
MPRILAIDDSPIIHKIITAALTPLGYQVITAPDGEQGLAMVRSTSPELVITDVVMPGIDGYEVTRRLRRDPAFAYLPILVLTSQASLDEKIRAFEAGADDYVVKPFEPGELAARLAVLLRRGQVAQSAQSLGLKTDEQARLIAVHSLRGGVGCSSLAVNTAIALAGLWDGKTAMLDLVTTSGQDALMLDMPLRRTWADIAAIAPNELDWEALETIIGQHASGLHLIAAPTSPADSENITGEHIDAILKLLVPRYDYVVADLSHDFNAVALHALDSADLVLLVLAPDLASIRSASAAVETYTKLGYPADKIHVVLNWTFQRQGFARKDIEAALRLPIHLVLPFMPDQIVTAINRGAPLMHTHPDEPVAALIEDHAYRISKERHLTIPPAAPKLGWQRVKKRLAAAATPPR